MSAELVVRGSTVRAGQVSWTCGIVFLSSLVLLAFCFLSPPRARAAINETVLDAAALEQLEQQASAAQPREQCFLFTELVHNLTEEAGREIASGQEDQAQATLKHAEAVMGKMHSAVQGDAKRLKNAELLMEHTSRRLSDMMHVASSASREAVQTAMQKLNALHTELLTQVFAK